MNLEKVTRVLWATAIALYVWALVVTLFAPKPDVPVQTKPSRNGVTDAPASVAEEVL